MKKMRAAELVLDFDLYPRGELDGSNQRSIEGAMLAGEEMPPVIACARTKRVADGFHRTRAALKVFGDDAEIDVVLKTYRTDADLFLDAMKHNSAHGVRLDTCDRARCTIIAERLHIPLELTAGALHMTVEALGSLRTARTARNAAGLSIPLKRTVAHKFAGRKLTKNQEAANEKLSGMSPLFYVNQLILLLDNDMLEEDDPKLDAALRRLVGLIEGRVGAVT